MNEDALLPNLTRLSQVTSFSPVPRQARFTGSRDPRFVPDSFPARIADRSLTTGGLTVKRPTMFSLLLCALLCAHCILVAQTTVHGRVTDARSGAGLPGVAVHIQSLGVGTYTNADGEYEFVVPAEKVRRDAVILTAKLMGYKEKTQRIILTAGPISADFALLEDVFQSDEVVVTGIASKTEKSVAEVAVARIDAAGLQDLSAYAGVNQLVDGKIPGVQMTTASGNIGSGWRFFVRGGGGLNGNGQPVIYVDGTRIENDEVGSTWGVGGQAISTLANLNTNDIEKIEFLKGPAAASMYGANGSNGVMLITTKAGALAQTPGGMNVNYNFTYGWNEQLTPYSKDEYLNADTANAMFRKGLIRAHYLSLAGGNNTLRYFTSFESRREDGHFPLTWGDRNTVRLNLTAVPAQNVSVKLNAGYAKNRMNVPNQDNSAWGILGNTLLVANPWFFVPKNDITRLVDVVDGTQFIGGAAMTYSPVADLELKGGVGIDNSTWRQDDIAPFGGQFGSVTRGATNIYDRLNRQITYDFGAAYAWSPFDNLSIRSIAGGQFFDRRFNSIEVNAEEYSTPLITDLGSAGKITGYGETFRNTRDGGLYTEHSAGYLDQYFLTLGVRQDFASVIGKSAPSIVYPKASAAWRLDRYEFFPSDVVQLLKLRAAYGESGVLPRLLDGASVYYTALVSAYGAGGVPTVWGNPAIKPERVREVEAGIDAEVANAVSLEFTGYTQKATNSIVDMPVAPSLGLSTTRPFNIGEVDLWGFESMVQVTPLRSDDYDLRIGLIWNFQRNEVKSIGGRGAITSDNNVIMEGKPKYEFLAYTSTAAFDSAGVYAGAVPSADKVDLGNPIPKYTGSVTVDFRFLKNFTFYAFGECGLDMKRFNYTRQFSMLMGGNAERIRMRAQLGFAPSSSVTPLTPGTPEYRAVAEKYGRLNPNFDGNFIEDADYFVIREVSLSYNFRDALNALSPFSVLKGLTVGVSVRNLWRTTKYSGVDVETNYAGSRTVTVGEEFLTLETPRTWNFWVKMGL